LAIIRKWGSVLADLAPPATTRWVTPWIILG
jgi:hypothetical protein